MKYTLNKVEGNDVNVTFTLDDGSESTQTIAVSSYGATVKEAVENYGRMYQAELAPVVAKKAQMIAEAEDMIGKEVSFDVNAEPEVKPLV
jgi:ribosome-binding protein aMBF1 (putative translation factor)